MRGVHPLQSFFMLLHFFSSILLALPVTKRRVPGSPAYLAICDALCMSLAHARTGGATFESQADTLSAAAACADALAGRPHVAITGRMLTHVNDARATITPFPGHLLGCPVCRGEPPAYIVDCAAQGLRVANVKPTDFDAEPPAGRVIMAGMGHTDLWFLHSAPLAHDMLLRYADGREPLSEALLCQLDGDIFQSAASINPRFASLLPILQQVDADERARCPKRLHDVLEVLLAKSPSPAWFGDAASTSRMFDAIARRENILTSTVHERDPAAPTTSFVDGKYLVPGAAHSRLPPDNDLTVPLVESSLYTMLKYNCAPLADAILREGNGVCPLWLVPAMRELANMADKRNKFRPLYAIGPFTREYLVAVARNETTLHAVFKPYYELPPEKQADVRDTQELYPVDPTRVL